jgi:hypothetical protein
MIITSKEPAFRFEDLARAAFNNCKKQEDPFGIAAQEVYNSLAPKPTLRGKRALSKVLIKKIIDYPVNEQLDDLISLENDIWNIKNQNDVNKIIEDTIQIFQHLKSQ